VRVRNLIGSKSLRYTCSSPCGPGVWAFVMVTVDPATNECVRGKNPEPLIRLCRAFWVPGTRRDGSQVPAEIHAEFQAQTIIHEASHLTHCTVDPRRWGRTIGVAECLSLFVAATNGSPLDSDFVGLCKGVKRCLGVEIFQRDRQGEISIPSGLARPGSQRKRILATIFRPEKAIRFKSRPAMRRGHQTELEMEEPFERWLS